MFAFECMCVSVLVCVCEREREKERDRKKVCVERKCVCLSVCAKLDVRVNNKNALACVFPPTGTRGG